MAAPDLSCSMQDTVPCCCLVAKLCPTLFDPMDHSPPGSLSMGFSRQEYWSGLPFLSQGDFPNLGIKPVSSAWHVVSLPLSHMGSPHLRLSCEACRILVP